MTPAPDWERLRAAADAARAHAHAPYSKFRVGAALQTDRGDVIAGVNVENASYGLTQCAERCAVTAAVAAGARRFVALAIFADGDTPASPCGACRQVLGEFAPGFEVRSYTERGAEARFHTDTLLPDPFRFDP